METLWYISKQFIHLIYFITYIAFQKLIVKEFDHYFKKTLIIKVKLAVVHNNKKLEVTVTYRLPLSFDSLLKGAAFRIYGQMCALEKASQCDSSSEPKDLFSRINKLLLRFILTKHFFIKSYAAKYNNNKGGIRIALITCLYDCAHIKYAWSLWKGRLCRLNANSVNTAISGLLSMFKLVVLE